MSIYSYLIIFLWLAVSKNDLLLCSVPRHVKCSWAFQKGQNSLCTGSSAKPQISFGTRCNLETFVALWSLFMSASPTSMKQRQHREHGAIDYHSPVAKVGMASVDWWGWWWWWWWCFPMTELASIAVSNPAQTQPWGRSDAFWGMVDMRATCQRLDLMCPV